MKYLIVGLGNPGREYEETRHNIGFKVLDELATAQGVSFKEDRLGWMAEFKHKGRTFVLVKPNTFMNLSGKSVRYWLQTTKLERENLLVILDDLALPFGKIRMRPKGSDGGHNGLKSIQELLGTSEYPRLRFGIGDEFSKGRQVDYVLGKWSEEESKSLKDVIQTAGNAVLSFGLAGLGDTMTRFNK
jgi:peptidyl-tRNA hydrolase, PTH1 family